MLICSNCCLVIGAAQGPLVSLGTNPTACLSPFVRVTLRNVTNENKVSVLAILDTGSEATLISQDVAEVLQLQSRVTNVRLRTFHGSDPLQRIRRTEFQVESSNGTTKFTARRAYIIPDLYVNERVIDWPLEKKKWPHLTNLSLERYDSKEVASKLDQ